MDLRQAIVECKKTAGSQPELVAALDALNQKLEVAVEPDADDDIQIFGLALPGNDRIPLPRVAASLTGLLVIEQNADSAPTADLAASAEKWNAASNASLARWKSVLSQDLASVNSQLQKANLKPLVVN
jgi:hypothetical protein